MSWKRCWNDGYSKHNFYEADYDEQIVPDIDRRPTSSSRSLSSSTSSMDASSSSSFSSSSSSSSFLPSTQGGGGSGGRGGGGIETEYHHQQPQQRMTTSGHAAAPSSPATSYRTFPSKQRGNNEKRSEGNNNYTFGHRSPLASDHRHTHYRVFGLKTTHPAVFSNDNNVSFQNANNSSSSTSSTASPWSNQVHKSSSSDFFGQFLRIVETFIMFLIILIILTFPSPSLTLTLSLGPRNGEKRSALELNDFWEEKYSRIAVITTTTTGHFGQTMSNKL